MQVGSQFTTLKIIFFFFANSATIVLCLDNNTTVIAFLKHLKGSKHTFGFSHMQSQSFQSSLNTLRLAASYLKANNEAPDQHLQRHI